LERLRAVLDRAELIHALNRVNRKPIQGRLQAGLSVGYGLTGFLVAWLSRHLRAIPIAILIGGLIAAGDALQLYSKIPSASATILQGLLFVAALGASGLAGRRSARHG
jgi:general nucleoside transport system permease protein